MRGRLSAGYSWGAAVGFEPPVGAPHSGDAAALLEDRDLARARARVRARDGRCSSRRCSPRSRPCAARWLPEVGVGVGVGVGGVRVVGLGAGRSSLAACSPATPAPMIPTFLTCAGGGGRAGEWPAGSVWASLRLDSSRRGARARSRSAAARARCPARCDRRGRSPWASSCSGPPRRLVRVRVRVRVRMVTGCSPWASLLARDRLACDV